MLGNKKIFAENLQYYMDKYGIDRNQLAFALGFRYSTISEWLQGNRYPRIDKIEMLANYFHIEKSALIEKHNEQDDQSIKDLINLLYAIPKEKREPIVNIMIRQAKITKEQS